MWMRSAQLWLRSSTHVPAGWGTFSPIRSTSPSGIASLGGLLTLGRASGLSSLFHATFRLLRARSFATGAEQSGDGLPLGLGVTVDLFKSGRCLRAQRVLPG